MVNMNITKITLIIMGSSFTNGDSWFPVITMVTMVTTVTVVPAIHTL